MTDPLRLWRGGATKAHACSVMLAAAAAAPPSPDGSLGGVTLKFIIPELSLSPFLSSSRTIGQVAAAAAFQCRLRQRHHALGGIFSCLFVCDDLVRGVTGSFEAASVVVDQSIITMEMN